MSRYTKETTTYFTVAKSLMCSIEDSLKYDPYTVRDIPNEHSNESIKRRIIVIRQELAKMTKELDKIVK